MMEFSDLADEAPDPKTDLQFEPIESTSEQQQPTAASPASSDESAALTASVAHPAGAAPVTGPGKPAGTPQPPAAKLPTALDHSWYVTTNREKYRRADGSYDYQRLNNDLLQTSLDKNLPVTRGDHQKLKGYLKKQLGDKYNEQEANELLHAADTTWANYEKHRGNAVRTSWASPPDSPFTRMLGYSANKPVLDTRPQDERLNRWGLQMHAGYDTGEDAADVLRKYADAPEAAERQGGSMYTRTEAETQLAFNNFTRDRRRLTGVIDEKTGERSVVRDPQTGLPTKKLGPLNPDNFHTWDFDTDGEPRLVEWDKNIDPNHVKGELLNIQSLLPKPEEATVAQAVLGSLTMGMAGNHQSAGENTWNWALSQAGYDQGRVNLKSSGSGIGQAVAEFGPLIKQSGTKLKGFGYNLLALADDNLPDAQTGLAKEVFRPGQHEAYRDAAQQAPNLNIDARQSMFANLPSFAHNLSQQGGQQLVQQSLNVVSGGTLGFAYMAATGAEQTYTDARKAHLGEGQATALGALIGMATYGTEHILDPKLWAGARRLLTGATADAATRELSGLVNAESGALVESVAGELEKAGLAKTATPQQVEQAAGKFLPGFYKNLKRQFDGVGAKYGNLKESLEQTALGGMALEAGQEFVQEGLDQGAQIAAYAGARKLWLEDKDGNPRPDLPAYQQQAMRDGNSTLAEKSWSEIYDETTSAMLGGAFAGGLFAAPFAWANAKSAREAQQHEVDANQTEQFANYLVDSKFSDKKAEKLRAEVIKWRDRSQLGPLLTPAGLPTNELTETQNHIVAQSLLNKIEVLHSLGKGTNLAQLVNGQNNKALAQLLSSTAGSDDGYARVKEGLETLYQTTAKKQEIQQLLAERPAMQLNAIGAVVREDSAALTSPTKPGFDTTQVLGMSAEAYAQEVIARRAALASDSNKNDDERAAAAKLLDQQVQRAKDPGALGVVTRNTDANAYYESKVLERELKAKIASAATGQEEIELQQQLAQQQQVSSDALRKAQANSADNIPLQRVLELTHKQLELEDLQQKQGHLFTGEFVANHIVSGMLNQYVNQTVKNAQNQHDLLPAANALVGALNQLGDQALPQLRTLTRWQQQYQRDAPATLAEQQSQQQQQSAQTSQQLVSLAQQLPALSLHDEASLQQAGPVVAQLADAARQATSLTLPTPEAKQHLVDVLTQEAERLRVQTQQAIPAEQLAIAVEQQVPGGASRLAQIEAALANPAENEDPEAVSNLQDEQQGLQEQLDDARESARKDYQHPLVQQLTEAASAVQALPESDATSTTISPDQLATEFYTGRHTGRSEPGELAKQAAEWAASTASELATRKESALTSLEEQAQLNGLHLALRHILGQQLHEPGVLPTGIAGKYLAPIGDNEYLAASDALSKVEQDLQTARDKFSQASGSRFDEDNKLEVQHRQRQVDALGQLADLASSSQSPVLQGLRPALLAFSQALASQQAALSTGDATTVASILTQAEENLRSVLNQQPEAWAALVNQLYQQLPAPGAQWQASEANTERGKFAESNLYQGSPYAGLFTYLNTLAGLSPARWATVYQQVTQGLKGVLPSLEQQAVIRDINGFLTGAQNVAFATGSQLAADEAQQTKNSASKFMAGRDVLYVPGSAGTGKTKMVIHTALLTQAALLGRSEASPLRVLATAPHTRQQQTLAQQLGGQASLAVQNVGVDELIKQLAAGTVASDVIVLDEGTILSDQQAQALLKEHAKYNATQTVPVRLVVLGDSAQMSGRDLQGNRSDKQFFVNPTQRFVLSTRPLTQVYRTGLITAFQLFDSLRTRILSGGAVTGTANQSRDLSPVPNMRFSQAGNDLTTLEGVQYLTADEQRDQAAELIKSLQQRGDQRTVAFITSRQLLESEVRQLRQRGVSDANKYVLASEDLEQGQNSIVQEIDQSQGGEFDFVFVAVQEQNRADALGTPMPDAPNTLRALNVGATRMTRYASLRYEPATNNHQSYQNQQVAHLERFEPETSEATTQRNTFKQAVLSAQSGVQTTDAAVVVPPTPPTPPVDPADLTEEQQQRKQNLEQLRDSLDEPALTDALNGPRELSWNNVQLVQQEAAKLEQLAAEAKGLSQHEDAKQPEMAALLDSLREAYKRHSAAHQQLLSSVDESHRNLLVIPADVLAANLQSQDAESLANKGLGSVAFAVTDPATGASQVVVTMPVGSVSIVQLPVDFSAAPVAELDEQGVLSLHQAHSAILTGAQLVREQRALHPLPPVSTEKVGGLKGPDVLPTDIKDKTQLALIGRVVLQHYGGVEQEEGRQNPRALQANQALQARIAKQVIKQSKENPREPGKYLTGYGNFTSDDMAGLPIPGRDGTFKGSAGGGEFFITWHPTHSAFGQGGGEQYKQNTFTVEYAEGNDRIGVALVYKDGVVEAGQGTVHKQGTNAPFDQALTELQQQPGTRRSLGASLPLERVNHPQFTDFDRQGPASSDVSGQFDYATLQQKMSERGIGVSSPWVITATVEDNVTLGSKPWAKKNENGDNEPSASHLSGRTVVFTQRVGVAVKSAAEVDEVVAKVIADLTELANNPEIKTVKASERADLIVETLLDKVGLEMQLLSAERHPTQLTDYFNSLQQKQDAPVPETGAELDKLLRGTVDAQGQLQTKDETKLRKMDASERSVKQMLFSPVQFEFRADKDKPQAERRGLRNKLLGRTLANGQTELGVLEKAKLITQGSDGIKAGANLSKFLKGQQKLHFLAILNTLQQQNFGGENPWDAVLGAWPEDLFTYLTYLDQKTEGQVHEAWQQSQSVHPVQVRFYGGVTETNEQREAREKKEAEQGKPVDPTGQFRPRTTPFSKVQTPVGLPIAERIGGTRLTMQSVSSVLWLEKALTQATPASIPVAAAGSAPAPAAVTATSAVATSQVQPTEVAATPTATAAATSPATASVATAVAEAPLPTAADTVETPTSEPAVADTSRSRANRRVHSFNSQELLQGDAHPAQAEALLRDLFGDKLDFQLNAGISFSKELGVMVGNLISLATDDGTATGRINLATARHEAIHRVLRLVSPVYRARLLDAMREVMRQDTSLGQHTAEQLADDNYVEERLADYYPQVAQYYRASGQEFKQRKLVKFLQGFGAGRLVLRALQAVYRAAERLKAEPDYLGQLFGDMAKGYYRERSVRQRYEEERAYQLNATPAGPGRVSRAQRQQDMDSLEDVFGGLDNVYGWLDRLRNSVYQDLFEFEPTYARRSVPAALQAMRNSAAEFYHEIKAEYGPDALPSVHDLNADRAEDAGWMALHTRLERPGPTDEDGLPTVRQTTPLDILLDFAFAHLQGGTAIGEQGVDRDAEAAQNNAGNDGSDTEQNSARVAAAQQAAAENTDGIPVWEKERELRQGANLDMHLESTPVYLIHSWSDFEANGRDRLAGTMGVPTLVRDSKRRYVDPKAAQKVLDRAFAGLNQHEVVTAEGVRSVLYNMIHTENGEAQHTAASLYLKFFNGHPLPGADTNSSAIYLEVTDPTGKENNQDVTPVSFFETVNPDQAGSIKVQGVVRTGQLALLDSYAQEHRRTLSELLMHYRSAVNKAAADVNVLEGLQITGSLKVPLNKTGTEIRDKHNQQRKTVGVSRLAGTFLRASLDQQGKVQLTTKPEALTAFENAGFALTADNTVAERPAVNVTYQGKPFMRWLMMVHPQGGMQILHQLQTQLPTQDLAKAYGAALAAAGIDVDTEQLSQVLDDNRSKASWRGKSAQSVLGYKNSRSIVPALLTSIWSQAYGQHLSETAKEAHPGFTLLADPRLQRQWQDDNVRTDLERLGVKPEGTKPIYYRSPLSAWKQVDETLALMSQWQKGGEQSSVRTADGAQKFLRGLGTSAVQRLRTLAGLTRRHQQAVSDFVLNKPFFASDAEKVAYYQANEPTLTNLLSMQLDAGLGWTGTVSNQPAQWGNYFLTGEVRHEGVITLNKLTNPLTGKAVDLVKASKGELHSAAVWHFFWKTWADTGGQRLALLNSPKADKTTQNANVHGKGSGQLVYQFADATGRTDAALQNLHNSYLAQFYGAVARRWQDARLSAELRFTAPANWTSLTAPQAAEVLQQHILSRGENVAQLLRRSALREGVDYVIKDGALKGFSPDLRTVLALTPQQYAQQIRGSVEQEAWQLIQQNISAPPVMLTKALRQNPTKEGGYGYDPHFKFRDKDLQGNVPDKLTASDGSVHPLLLDYLLTHRVLAQHLDTAMTGHHIYYPKGPVDMVKRGVMDHTAYETPDVSNPRGLPRYSKVLVMDDLKAGQLSADGSHNAQFKALLKGLGMNEGVINETVDGQDLQDGLAFMDPLYWRQERESQGMKYPLREQIKNIQGGMSQDGTPFVFKNSYLVLSNEMLKLGGERVWNMVAQSLGGYESPLYKRWLAIRAPMTEQQITAEADWDQLHTEFIAARSAQQAAHEQVEKALKEQGGRPQRLADYKKKLADNSRFYATDDAGWGKRIVQEEAQQAIVEAFQQDKNHPAKASFHTHHIGRIILASGNKVAAHSVRSMDYAQDPNAHEGAFEVDNLLGGRVLSLYQNPTGASIANITQENHMLAPGGDNYQAMHQIYDLLGQLAYQGLDQLQTEVTAAATKSSKLGDEAYFYQKAIDSLTALGNISNTLSLTRSGADANVPLVAKALQGAIASTINSFAVKQRMNGLRATVATMSGLVPMYNVSWTDENNVPRFERYTQAQVLKRELATLSDGQAGPATMQWREGISGKPTELQFTHLVKAVRDAEGIAQSHIAAEPDQAEQFMREANKAMATKNYGQLDALIEQHGYALTGQEILIPREMASQFNLAAADDVADVNEAGPAYFMAQHNNDASKAQEAWENWLMFIGTIKSTRVPVTNMNSTQMSQVVGFINNHGNTVFMPSEAQTVSGCDNDGDQTTLEGLEVRHGGLLPMPGTPAAIRRQIFEQKAKTFSDVRNINQLVRLLSNAQINQLAKEADQANEDSKVQYGASRGFHSHASNIDIWSNAHAGKAGVGPMVKVRETFNNLYALAKANVSNTALTQFGVPSYFGGQVYASITDKVQRVMEVLEELANGALDNTKNNTLGPLNMNDHTFGAYGAAATMGWSLPDMVRVLNHPAVRQVVEKLQSSNSVFTRKSEEVKLLNSMQPSLLSRFGISSQMEQQSQYNEEITMRDKPQSELQSELVAAITTRHQQQSVAGEPVTPELAVEHFYLMAARGEQLLEIQRVLSPMSGVDSADYDSENAIMQLVETLTGGKPASLEQAIRSLGGVLASVGKGEIKTVFGQLVVNPRAVFEANKFAVAGAQAMLKQARILQQNQILRQPNTRQAYIGYLREAGGSEARSYKMHGQLTQAFDQILDSRFLSRTGGVAVPLSILEDQQQNPATYNQLWNLQQADLQTLAGRHAFVEAASTLLSQVKLQGGSDASFFGGLGQSPLVKELKFDQDNQSNFGMMAQLERATEMDPSVKNKLEREFNKLTRLNPDYGKLLQDVLVTYQLLTKGLTTGRGSFAEIFGPQALADYSADRASVKTTALAGKVIVTSAQADQVLVRQPSLLPMVQPRNYAPLTEEQQNLMEAGEDPGDSPLTDDQQHYYAKPESLPATLSNDLVERGLSKRQKQQLKKQVGTTGKLITLRNKLAGLVIYKSGNGKWTRQFPIGNPAVNSYELGVAHPVLSSLPVYEAGSASGSEDLSDQNPRVQQYLQQVRAYVQKLPEADRKMLLSEPGLRAYTKFGQPMDVDMVKVCS